MIFNDHGYNPLPIIFNILKSTTEFTEEILNSIQHELFKGGIVPENSEEFVKVVNCLIDLKKEHIDG